jgi:hypothetical protein
MDSIGVISAVVNKTTLTDFIGALSPGVGVWRCCLRWMVSPLEVRTKECDDWPGAYRSERMSANGNFVYDGNRTPGDSFHSGSSARFTARIWLIPFSP